MDIGTNAPEAVKPGPSWRTIGSDAFAIAVFVLFVSLVVFLSQSDQCSLAAPSAAPSTQRVIDLRGAENQTSIGRK